MNKLNIGKMPIVVVGSGPRCGSTAFVKLLESQMKIPAFSEPWNRRMYIDKDCFDTYREYLKTRLKTKNYIVKFWLYDLEHRSPYHEDFQNGYKILVLRRNIVDQIASEYVAEYNQKWHMTEAETLKDYSIKIVPNDISVLIQHVTRFSYLSDLLNIFDKKIYYEDINFSNLTNYKYVKYKHPENIEMIKDEIRKQMTDILPSHWQRDINEDLRSSKLRWGN